MTNRVIPAEAVEAALKAWGDWPEGVSPQEQVTRILEAAAPYMQGSELTPGDTFADRMAERSIAALNHDSWKAKQ